jgi:hypothetical protein
VVILGDITNCQRPTLDQGREFAILTVTGGLGFLAGWRGELGGIGANLARFAYEVSRYDIIFNVG